MFENPRRGRQARNFEKNVLKISDLKSSFEQIFSEKLSLGAPDHSHVKLLTWIKTNCMLGLDVEWQYYTNFTLSDDLKCN